MNMRSRQQERETSRERRVILSLANDAEKMVKDRLSRGKRPVQNIYAAMDQYPAYKNMSQSERREMHKLIRAELIQRRRNHRQDRMAAQRQIALEQELQAKRVEEQRYLDKLEARRKKRELMVGAKEHQSYHDSLLAEQEELDAWRNAS